MATKDQIVVTGMGAVTPVGVGVDRYWDNLTAGKCGIDRISSFDASELAVQIAAEVTDFDPEDYLPGKQYDNDDNLNALFHAAFLSMKHEPGRKPCQANRCKKPIT